MLRSTCRDFWRRPEKPRLEREKASGPAQVCGGLPIAPLTHYTLQFLTGQSRPGSLLRNEGNLSGMSQTNSSVLAGHDSNRKGVMVAGLTRSEPSGLGH